MSKRLMYCAQHSIYHSQIACQRLSAAEAEEKETRLEFLAEQIQNIHQDTNIDGYGDEGAGYDYKEQVRLLIAAGWMPPEEEE